MMIRARSVSAMNNWCASGGEILRKNRPSAVCYACALPADRRRFAIFTDFLLIFLFAAALIGPLFFAGYLNQWGSIESTFIADARFLIEHWPHPKWQPLWYAGTRFDYIYPPALRYGTAVLSMLFHIEPVRAYHLYTALFYAIGIAGVYALVWVGTRSRGSAWVAAISTALVSPSFLFLGRLRRDSPWQAPQRLHVLVSYGEGPHMTAIALLPIALAFAWLAMERRRAAYVALAAIFCAAVVSNNFYGATALAVFYALLIFSFAITRGPASIAAAAPAIPLAAYGLTAFWLTPSYIRVTANNMRYVSDPARNAWSIPVAIAAAVLFAIAAWILARNQPKRTWGLFVASGVFFFTVDVLGNYFLHFVVTGVPLRWVPELDLVLIFGAMIVLRQLWTRRTILARAAVILIAAAALFSAKDYVGNGWRLFEPHADVRARAEYRISDWLWRNLPGARVKASGSVRIWLDAWHDISQLGGGSDQGLINGTTFESSYEIDYSPKADVSVLWMQCLGVDAVYAAQPNSEEVYKELRYPEKFAGVLPVLFDDGQGNVIYKIPRRYPVRARIVETARFNALARAGGILDADRLRQYADLVEHGPDALVSLTRESPETIRLRAHLDAGQSIIVQESYDPAWRAWSGTTPLPVRRDMLGFMRIDPPPGDQRIILRFITPLENRVGIALTWITIACLVFFLASR
jgi:hypothetical protein